MTAVSIPQRASISGSDSSTTWSAPTGRIVKWSTGAVVAGRRLTGHTYLVPSSPSAFAEGSINTTVVLSDATAHAALITALAATTAPLAVWSRTHGQVGVVQGGATLSRPTVLRSRND